MKEDYGLEPDLPSGGFSVCIACNLKPEETRELPRATLNGASDSYEEYDSIETVEAIAGQVRSFGFSVSVIEQNDHFLSRIEQNRPNFVLNIAEGRGISRGREAQVPAILESLDIPFTGSDSVSMALSLDKYLTNKTLAGEGVPVPKAFLFRKSARNALPKTDSRWIVKPRFEGSSKGIFPDSLAKTESEVHPRVDRIWSLYNQDAIVEEFLPGDEITVGVFGNEEPWVGGMMRIAPAAKEKGDFLYSLEHKREWKTRVRYEGPDTIPADVREKAESCALMAFQALELRDVSRIDLRLDESGNPRVIDVNPLPGLSPTYSDLPILYRLSGGAYEDIIRTILSLAFRRNGIPRNILPGVFFTEGGGKA